ncbi:U-Kazal-Dg21.2-like [Eurosta solidaginis]|uniref:U-Kazal-Dg21.2-like n=1 Tax=Eurosta solidaginis TaxID=178769 RepID=UPI0035307D4E
MANNTTKHLCTWLGLFLLAVSVTAKGYDAPRPCNRLVKCSSEEDVVWATDGKNCTAWRNACQLGNENCQRQNRYEKLLTPIEKEECQKLCKRNCTLEYFPVCAEYKGNTRTFGNKCALGAHICATGETYVYISQGEC